MKLSNEQFLVLADAFCNSVQDGTTGGILACEVCEQLIHECDERFATDNLEVEELRQLHYQGKRLEKALAFLQ